MLLFACVSSEALRDGASRDATAEIIASVFRTFSFEGVNASPGSGGLPGGDIKVGREYPATARQGSTGCEGRGLAMPVGIGKPQPDERGRRPAQGAAVFRAGADGGDAMAAELVATIVGSVDVPGLLVCDGDAGTAAMGGFAQQCVTQQTKGEAATNVRDASTWEL
mmetsp:Transcript_136081/g.435300  ORF Transcript_136081/g.435300 Transcript_136081/m.435300 type:complete len:166 (+) Transcript_136081:74-571(+)